MGLRINTNISALTALNNLRLSDTTQQRSLQRLSTGLRINSAGDDPSGLVLADQFKAEIGSLGQALQNTQFASSLVGTAEGGLSEISNILVGIRASIISGLNETGDPDLLALEQDTIDQAVAALDRIANTTRFGRANLLNGGSEFRTSSVDSGITSLNLRSVFFGAGDTANTFTVTVDSVASHGGLTLGTFGSGGSGVVRVTGNLGSKDIIVSSATFDLSGAINSVREFTGVIASGGSVFSEGLGESQKVAVTSVSGTAYTGGTGTDFGEDASVTVSGAATTGDGLNVSISGSFLKGELTLSDGLTAGATLSFGVRRSGVNFQLGTGAGGFDSIRIGIGNFESGSLGTPTLPSGGASTSESGGFLSTITAGGANALDGNPGNALAIVDAALDQVNRQRGFLGAVEQQNLVPNVRSLGVAIENLTASESQIRDLNFAEEVAEFTRAQVLFAAGLSTLASANIVPQQVLGLLS